MGFDAVAAAAGGAVALIGLASKLTQGARLRSAINNDLKMRSDVPDDVRPELDRLISRRVRKHVAWQEPCTLKERRDIQWGAAVAFLGVALIYFVLARTVPTAPDLWFAHVLSLALLLGSFWIFGLGVRTSYRALNKWLKRRDEKELAAESPTSDTTVTPSDQPVTLRRSWRWFRKRL